MHQSEDIWHNFWCQQPHICSIRCQKWFLQHCGTVFLVWRHHVANDPCSFNIDIRRVAFSPSIAKWRQWIKLSPWTVLDAIEFGSGAYIFKRHYRKVFKRLCCHGNSYSFWSHYTIIFHWNIYALERSWKAFDSMFTKLKPYSWDFLGSFWSPALDQKMFWFVQHFFKIEQSYVFKRSTSQELFLLDQSNIEPVVIILISKWPSYYGKPSELYNWDAPRLKSE